jgi:rRNA maturation endonuclease Nob1
MKVIKCLYCKKAFFDIDTDICPYCGKNIKIAFFGEDNPLNDIFNGFGGFTDEKN